MVLAAIKNLDASRLQRRELSYVLRDMAVCLGKMSGYRVELVRAELERFVGWVDKHLGGMTDREMVEVVEAHQYLSTALSHKIIRRVQEDRFQPMLDECRQDLDSPSFETCLRFTAAFLSLPNVELSEEVEIKIGMFVAGLAGQGKLGDNGFSRKMTAAILDGKLQFNTKKTIATALMQLAQPWAASMVYKID
jgi:hypothetical protein